MVQYLRFRYLKRGHWSHKAWMELGYQWAQRNVSHIFTWNMYQSVSNPSCLGGLKKFGTIYVGVLAFNFLRERKSQSLQTQEQDNYKKTKQLPVPTAVKEGRKQDVSTVSTQNGINKKFGRYR